MRLGFNVKTNESVPMINTAIFELPDGTRITIDRDETEYASEIMEDGSYKQRMLWKGCYAWNSDGATYLAQSLPIGTKLVKLEPEDDADEGYYVEVESWFCSLDM